MNEIRFSRRRRTNCFSEQAAWLGAPYTGEEVIAAAVISLHDDYITSTHRGHGHGIAKSGDPAAMAELMGKDGLLPRPGRLHAHRGLKEGTWARTPLWAAGCPSQWAALAQSYLIPTATVAFF